jgi:hypothetical protein
MTTNTLNNSSILSKNLRIVFHVMLRLTMYRATFRVFTASFIVHKNTPTGRVYPSFTTHLYFVPLVSSCTYHTEFLATVDLF